ncbi:hypothetical protein [Streptomyces fagopyri]|uniref:hypothetical protein n=1 Tax=Streptomyces fagopyri TaxID=2662397 RepID=UPI003825C151
MWLAQDNGHGPVACYGLVLGTAVLLLTRRFPHRVPTAAVPTGHPSRAGER